MSVQTLRDLLIDLRPAGPPPEEVRRRRQALAEFVRQVEPRVFRADGRTERDRLRGLLGWDDQSLHTFVNSTMVVHSSTHVSMNAFAPMLTFPWFCLRMTTAERALLGPGSPSHLRTQVTHNNLSDNRWKPHVWWRIDSKGELRRTPLFSKAPRFEHQLLLCQPTPEIPTDDLAEGDREAVELAGRATNFAYFAMIYRMSLERQAGLHLPDGTVEVPIDLMNAFSLHGSDAFAAWRSALHRCGMGLRRIGADRELHAVPQERADEFIAGDPLVVDDTSICPNYVNVGQAYRLGLSVTMGAEKMSAYEAEMNQVLEGFFEALGEEVTTPQFLGVRSIDLDRLAPLPEPVVSGLRPLGGKPSFPLYAALFGPRLTPALDAALDRPVGDLAGIVTRTW
ncbi:hypothetical protein [Kitasatospora sp. SUK 42]|uniref:hypothetical protein n=1 Tax=Kitasatospora sp. SUK 42 TaxID=1588882 RepID=UPI0018C9A987|nr:hypothetical protein [Kitasatospora sp. SUK 42]MBV2153289.1 hypothetical protein [Kitasatospora sp. SUK 42]